MPPIDGVDFTGLPLTVTILQGMTRGCGTLTILDDTMIEATETIALTLTSTGNIDASRDSATVVIQDNGELLVKLSWFVLYC